MKSKRQCFLSTVLLALMAVGLALPLRAIGQSSEPAGKLSAMIWDSGVDLPELFQLESGDEFPEGAELYLWQGGVSTEPLLIPYGARSQPFDLTSGREVVLLKRPFNPELEGDSPPVSSRISIPSSMSRALIVLVPDDLLNNDYRALAFDEGLEAFPANSIRLVNFAEFEIIVRINDQAYTVQPYSSHMVNLGENEGRSMKVLVAHTQEGRQGYDYLTRRISVFDGIRATCFFVHNKENGALQVRLMTEDARYINPQKQSKSVSGKKR